MLEEKLCMVFETRSYDGRQVAKMIKSLLIFNLLIEIENIYIHLSIQIDKERKK